MKGGKFMDKIKKYLVVMLSVAASLLGTLSVFAESQSGTANSAVTGAMTTVANDMIATGNAIIPIALSVVGISAVVVFGVRIFRKVAKPY